MKKIINKICLILVISLCIMILYSCTKTNNEINNKSYDVNVDITNIHKAFVPAVEIASESTVGVTLYEKENIFSSYATVSTGSGVVYSGYAMTKDGNKINDISSTKDNNNINYYCYYVLTNEHVIATTNNNSQLKVYLTDIQMSYNAKVLGTNVIEDLAVISFETTVYITPIVFGNSDQLQKGEIVLAVGNPEGFNYASSATLGIVSYPKRYMDVTRNRNKVTCEFIQHDAAINPGNSGGALVDINGKLVGLNTLKIINSDDEIDGMGFAIPINLIKTYITYLETGTNKLVFVPTGNLYSLEHINNSEIYNAIPEIIIPDEYPFENGVFVSFINSSRFGLKKNDIIIELNNEKVLSVGSLTAMLRKCSQNDIIIWKVFRDNEVQEISIKLVL